MTVVLCATDLDRTLIYSRKAVEAYGGDPAALVAVEQYRGADASWMSRSAAAQFAALHDEAIVVPSTTRAVEQLARIRLPGPVPRWAVAANGGVLLVDGARDEGWASTVRARLSQVVSLAQAHAYAGEVCRPEWTSALRTAEELFCYAVLDRAAMPEGLVDEARAWAQPRGWTVSLQGRKLYWVPAPLTKSAAVAEIARRTGAQRVLAAGDSLLDADLLAAADAGIMARHGELAACGWHREHVEVTEGCGVAAGEQIVEWFAASVGRGC